MNKQNAERILGSIMLTLGLIGLFYGIQLLNALLITAGVLALWFTIVLYVDSFLYVTVFVLSEQPERVERLRTAYINMKTAEIELKPNDGNALWDVDGDYVVVCPAVIVEKEKVGKLQSLKAYIMGLFG